jgi:hypothetical protein
MPFPLAHPAAVLPLRRYCPRFLSLPALVIGSITPDLGYFFVSRHLDELTHRLLGTFVFCLPVGLILLSLFYAFRSAAVGILPGRYQRVFQPLCQRPSGTWSANIFSLLIGSWSHLVWDSFTHQDGWLVGHLTILQSPLAVVAGRTMRVCHVLWYASSFLGVAWVFLCYIRWQRAATGCVSRVAQRTDLVFSSLVALFLLPIELVHHLITGGLGLVLAGGSTLLMLLVIVRRIGRDFPLSTVEEVSELGRAEQRMTAHCTDATDSKQ